MKWSMFNLYIDDVDFVIIRNTLTAATARIDKKIKNAIDNLLSIVDDNYLYALKDPTKQEKIAKILLRQGIIVSSNLNEKEKYKELFLKHQEKDTTLSLYIVPTTDCQLDCPYCFEGHNKKNEYMTINEANKLISWTDNYLSQNNCDKLRIIFYGGEPLLNKKTIRHILPGLKYVADTKNIKIETGILTNAEYLDYEICAFLAKYNLDRVQITLDGPEKIHDSRRYHKKTKTGSFQSIVKNIYCLLENNFIEKINLRINFDKQNIELIPELFDIFVSKRLEKRIILSFGIITSTIPDNKENYFCENTPGQKLNAEKYLWLCSEAKKRGFSIPKEFLAGPWCTARKIHSAIILPNGDMLKCISLVGRDSFFFGNIKDCNNLEDKKFLDFQYIDTCLDKECSFVPICGGGCRFEAYLSRGNFFEPHCQEEMIEKINKGLLSLNYK